MLLSRNLAGNAERTKSPPPGRRAGLPGEPGVSGGCSPALLLLEQGFEGCFPSRAQRCDAQGPHQLIRRMARPVKQGIDVGDAHAFGAGRYLDDFVTGLQLAFFKNPAIKARPGVRDQQRGHLWLVQTNTDAIARDARLRDFEQRAANPIAVADAHVVIGQPINGKVLAELPVREVISAELLLPELIQLDLIDENRPLLAPMPGEIALSIAIDVEAARHATALNRALPDTGVNSLASPRDVTRQANID